MIAMYLNIMILFLPEYIIRFFSQFQRADICLSIRQTSKRRHRSKTNQDFVLELSRY